MDKLNIIIADDHYIFRHGLKTLLRRLSNIGTIEEASNGKEVLEYLQFSTSYLVFLDIEMPIMNGIETLDIIRQKYPSVKVIMLSMFANDGYIDQLYEKKVHGYLMKNTTLSELKRAIENVGEGNPYFCQEIAGRLYKRLIDKEELSEDIEEITERERAVLLLICEQYSTPEIAEKLFISERTVERFRQNLLDKTGSKNSIGLVLYAIKKGIKTLETSN